MASPIRPNQHPWVTPYQAAPPPSCATLRLLSNTIAYGLQCVFAEEDSSPSNSINTACLPWATSSLPGSNTFYSPATACPTSWTAVATRRTAAAGVTDWVYGETAVECCPPGFVGGAGGMCNPGVSGTTQVVRCGEADAEENDRLVLTAGSWPASVTASVGALQLRYRDTDLGVSVGVTGSGGASEGTGMSTSSSDSGSGSTGGGELSTGAKAAIGTVVPLVFVLGAFAAFLLWRRRKHQKAALAVDKDLGDGHETKQSYEAVAQSHYNDSKPGFPGLPAITATGSTAAVAAAPHSGQHETPEWNAELDATEAERRRYMAFQGSLFPGQVRAADVMASPEDGTEVSELGGMMRVGRKPVAPVELDSSPFRTELDGNV